MGLKITARRRKPALPLPKMSTAQTIRPRRSKDESAKNFNKDLAVAEGVKTSLAVHLLAEKLGVEMPICASVYEVIHKGSSES